MRWRKIDASGAIGDEEEGSKQRSSRTRGKRTTKRGDTVRVRLLIVFFGRVSLDQR